MEHCMSERYDNYPATLWKIMEKVGLAMVVTHKRGRLESRPLQVSPEPDVGRDYFMTDSERVMDEINAKPHVLLSFTDVDGNDRAAIDGQAVATNDRDKIRERWPPWAKAFWDSAEVPSLRVIDVTPYHAR
jgi:general stress protein 26